MNEDVKERLTDPHTKLEKFLFKNWRTILTVAFALTSWYSANIYQRVKVIPMLISNDSTGLIKIQETAATILDIQRQIRINSDLILIMSRIECANLDALDRGKYGINCQQIPLPIK